jgi:hypothetical protein
MYRCIVRSQCGIQITRETAWEVFQPVTMLIAWLIGTATVAVAELHCYISDTSLLITTGQQAAFI